MSAVVIAMPAQATAPLRVLVYDSFVGQGSLGEWIAQQAQQQKKPWRVEWVVTQDVVGLEGRIRTAFQRKDLKSFDAVLGLDRAAIERLRRQGVPLGSQPLLFEHSPLAIVVDRRVEKARIEDWTQLGALKGGLFLQDPALSSTGFGFLQAVFGMKLLDLKTAKSLVKRSFPSWSASYSAFLKTPGAAVWSFLSSEAYHRCEEKTDRFEALTLKGRVPIHESYFVSLGQESRVGALEEFLGSNIVQEQIPLKNWMFPGLESATWPACFEPLRARLGQAREFHSKERSQALHSKDRQAWLDQWSL